MKFYILAAAVSAVVAVAPASARDFNGGYAGVALSLDNVQTSGSFEGIGFSGVGVSGFAGYDVPLSTNVFAGVEANIDGYTADADQLGTEIDAKWGWGVSARLGTKLNDSTGVYARVGYARAREVNHRSHPVQRTFVQRARCGIPGVLPCFFRVAGEYANSMPL